jgi:peroxiredoxin
MLRALFFIVVLLLLSAPVYSQFGPRDGTNLTPIDLQRIKVGDEAPDFTLENIDGRAISLSAFRAKKNVILVFYRGHW